jgi:gamma-glutamyltranspeptidase/glutathione hydrolase|tara:strand:+ start:287 stop:1825 length:1539 start_codon:yes stop_codon:yes gene_type:complete
VDRNIIAAGDKATAETAKETLWLGGNAYDAAVAAVFTSMTAEPSLTGPGGGGHFMAYPADGQAVLFDFFVDMPSGVIEPNQMEFFDIEVDYGPEQQQFHVGKGSIAVPGTVAGLLHVHDVLGKLDRKDLMAPAIRVAKEGAVLSDEQAYLVKILAPILNYEAAGKKLYSPNKTLLQTGDRLAIPDLADFLDGLACEGVNLMYKGEVADRIVEWVGEEGLLKKADLEQYKVKERTPISTDFFDHQVYLNPPPAMSGILIDFSLCLLERMILSAGPSIELIDIALALSITNEARQNKLPGGTVMSSRPRFCVDDDFQTYVEKFFTKRLRRKNGQEPNSRGATTQVSILDTEGNTASVTTTNGEGCGYILPDLGFMLNNMLGEEDLNPQGFHLHKPGDRLPSMVAPTIVMKNGAPAMVTGSAGSNRIRSAIVQVIVNVLYGDMEVEEAVVAPRIHVEGNTLQVEPGVDEVQMDKLKNFFEIHRWNDLNLYFGGANSVTPQGGAGDPRRGGAATVT